MALDTSHSIECFQLSVKKYFVDVLATGQGIHLDFNQLEVDPVDALGNKVTEWVNFHFMPIAHEEYVATGKLSAYVLSRLSVDDVNLVRLCDKVLDSVIDLTSTDGLQRIPLYDQTLTQKGSMIVDVGHVSQVWESDNDLRYVHIDLNFYFGSK